MTKRLYLFVIIVNQDIHTPTKISAVKVPIKSLIDSPLSSVLVKNQNAELLMFYHYIKASQAFVTKL